MRSRSSFPRWKDPRVWTAGVLLLLVLGRLLYSLSVAPDPLPDPEQSHRVKRVVDGDTLLLESGHRIRLIGVDCPEMNFEQGEPEPFAERATELTRELVAGKRIRLEFDQERVDRYQRVLAYVYLGEECLNEILIREGLGQAMLQFPYSNEMKKRFSNAQEQARTERKGLWND